MNNHINKKISAEKLTAIMLIVVFTLPFVGAWVIYSYTDFGSGGEVSSHGRLILPPGHVADTRPADLSNTGTQNLHGKWNLVYQSTGSCARECERALEIMRGTRAVLGNDAPRLQLVLVISQPNLNDALKSRLADKRILTLATIEITGLNNRQDIVGGDDLMKDALFLIDPLGNLMMRYSPESTLAGVIKDIKRLLHNSRIG